MLTINVHQNLMIFSQFISMIDFDEYRETEIKRLQINFSYPQFIKDRPIIIFKDS